MATAVTVAVLLALIALWLAGYALLVVRRTEAAVAEFIEAASDEDEAPEPDSAELWVSDGDLHTPDAAALYAATGALAIYMQEGVPMAVIDGKGTFSLHKLLSESTKQDAAKVRAIKP